MKFPYVPLDAILAEVETQFKMMNKQGKYNENDAYTYAIEAAREIGMNNYEESTALIVIDGHAGAIPPDFYLAGEIWAADICDTALDIVTVLDAFKKGYTGNIRRNYILYPGDSATVRYSRTHTTLASGNIPSYTFRIPPGTIRTSFKKGLVTLQYYHLPKDERGVIMIQDEVNTIKCVKAYVLTGMLKEDYYSGKIARYIYKDAEDEFYTYLSQAKGMQKLPDPAGAEAYAQQVQNRYNPFKL